MGATRVVTMIGGVSLLAASLGSCSEARSQSGWCGRADQVARLETGGLGRVAFDQTLAGELALAYDDLVGVAPAALAADVVHVRDFTATISAQLDDGADPIDVIDRVTHEFDVAAVEAAHARIVDDVDQSCGSN